LTAFRFVEHARRQPGSADDKCCLYRHRQAYPQGHGDLGLARLRRQPNFHILLCVALAMAGVAPLENVLRFFVDL
jgi:hypothetical protein